MYRKRNRMSAKLAAARDAKARARIDGAMILCRAIDAVIFRTGCSAKRAITELSARIIDSGAHPELIEAAHITYAKPRKSGQTVASLISRLQKMYAAYLSGAKQGDACAYLVPGAGIEDQALWPIFVAFG